jgi:glycosyltransferase involved in cell wall biosynthesis
MKSVLIFSDCILHGGSELVILNLLKSQRINEKFEVHYAFRSHKEYNKKIVFEKTNFDRIIPVFLLSNDNLNYKYKNAGLIKYIILIWPIILEKLGFYFLINSFIFSFLFLRIKPDILFINNGGYPGAKNCLYAAIIAKIHSIKKVVMNINNMAHNPRFYFDVYFDFFLNMSVTHFVTASKAAKVKLATARKFPEEKIINIPNTVVESYLNENHSICNRQFDNSIIVGGVGLLTKRKGFNIFIESINVLIKEKKINNIKFYIIGDGEEREKYLELIHFYKLSEFIFLPGFSKDILSVISSFDLFVLPSISNEDMPYVLLEAMSLKKPIISTNVAGIPEVVLNNYNGLIVNPGDIIELSNAMEKLINNSSLRELFGMNGYQLFKSKFSYEKAINSYAELLSK